MLPALIVYLREVTGAHQLLATCSPQGRVGLREETYPQSYTYGSLEFLIEKKSYSGIGGFTHMWVCLEKKCLEEVLLDW